MLLCVAAAWPAAASEGADLLAAGRYAEALPVLERQVMLQPEDTAAWLDFALANRHLGFHEEAQRIFDFIEQELAPNEAIRAVIARHRTVPFGAGILARGRWRADVALLAGRESNANAGPVAQQFALTINQTPVLLTLDPALHPRASASGLLEARLEGAQPLTGSLALSAYADWRERRVPDAPGADTRQAQAHVALSGGVAGGGSLTWTLAAGALDIAGEERTLLTTRRLAALLEHPLGPCRLQGGLEHETRHYPVQDALDGRYSGPSVALGCPAGGGQIFLAARSGRDVPEGFRAGGAQRREDLTAVWRLPVGGAGRLEILAALARSRDAEGYSALFGGEARRIARRQLRLEYAHSLGPALAGWEALVRVEGFTQRSNIGLFEIEGRSAHLGLRKAF